jgi:beta-glucosidase
MDVVRPGDLEIVAAPTDFLGANYYTREVMAAGPRPGEWQAVLLDAPRTEMGWEIYPQGLYQLLLRLHSAYDVPKIYITENGVSYLDGPGADGQVHDERRTSYLRDHLAACQRAMSAGVPLAGYFYWSLIDNFEWGHGYEQRFGIVHVDYQTQQRTPKDSFFWYRDAIAANGFAGS